MAAQRKSAETRDSGAAPAAAPAATQTPGAYARLLGPAGDDSGAAARDGEAPSPAHALQARILAEFHEPLVEPWGAGVRWLVIGGFASGLWVLIAAAALVLLH